jgi:hypothetical protein
MSKLVHGKIHGRTIEISEDLGLAEGQQVEIHVKAVHPGQQWGDGLLRCAGAMTNEWTAEDDRILAEIYADRKLDARREISE